MVFRSQAELPPAPPEGVLQTLLTHALPLPQSPSAWQGWSAQRPALHVLSGPQSCAAVASLHSATHFLSAEHFCPSPQSWLLWHCALATQMLSWQVVPGFCEHWESSRHCLQVPPMQTRFSCPLQSSSLRHSGYGGGFGGQPRSSAKANSKAIRRMSRVYHRSRECQGGDRLPHRDSREKRRRPGRANP